MNTYCPTVRLRSSKGYTLVELMVAMVIVGILSMIAVPRYQGYIEKARYARCVAEIRYLERDIQAYYVANEKYPDSIAELGLSIIGMLDPWGNPYQYLKIAGTKWASNKGTGGPYYVRHFDWAADVVAATDPAAMRGFWTGSWFVSEAWAQGPPSPPPTPPTPPAPAPPPTPAPSDPGASGSTPAASGSTPAASGGTPAASGGTPAAGGSPPGQSGDPGNSGNAGGGNAGGSGGNAGGNSGNAGGGGQGGGQGGSHAGGSAKPRKDRFLVPINSDYDLYSMGPDGKTNEPLNVPVSRDDIVRASNGAYVGVAENF